MTPRKSTATNDVQLAHMQSLTVEQLFTHSRFTDDGHLIWAGYAQMGRTPQVRLGGRQGAIYNVRRAIYVQMHGRIRNGLRVTARCPYELCVHPECVIAGTRSALQKGKPRSLQHRLNITAGKRRTASALNAGLVQKIRAFDGTSAACDREYGLADGTTSAVRRGKRWADVSMLVQLGARA